MKNRYLIAIVALLLVLVIGASLAACTPTGNDVEGTTTAATTLNDEPTPTTPAETTADGGTDATTTEEYITEETETGLQGVTDVKDNGFDGVVEFK